MPSVMTIEGPECKYVITRGEYGRRSFHGCFSTKTSANKAAKRRGRGWRVVFSRPPGVPMGGQDHKSMCWDLHDKVWKAHKRVENAEYRRQQGQWGKKDTRESVDARIRGQRARLKKLEAQYLEAGC
jgi:hypothetical protein